MVARLLTMSCNHLKVALLAEGQTFGQTREEVNNRGRCMYYNSAMYMKKTLHTQSDVPAKPDVLLGASTTASVHGKREGLG
jgi:hypothetical protein